MIEGVDRRAQAGKYPKYESFGFYLRTLKTYKNHVETIDSSVETSQLVMTRVVRSSDGQQAVCIMYVVHQRTVEFKDNEHLEVSVGDVTGARPAVVQ